MFHEIPKRLAERTREKYRKTGGIRSALYYSLVVKCILGESCYFSTLCYAFV